MLAANNGPGEPELGWPKFGWQDRPCRSGVTMGHIVDLETLAGLRRDGDPEADDYVARIVAPAEPGRLNSTLGALIATLRALDPLPGIESWIGRPFEPPPWVDEEAVVAGQRFFDDWSLEVVTCLFCASLPFAYAAAKGVEVLERTSQLADQATVARRIAETGQMLIDVTRPGGLDPGERGIRSVRSVRLLHAAIRARLTLPTDTLDTRIPPWNTAELGIPVNQEDLLGTLLSFTEVVFRALRRLGVEVADDEQAAYLQLWGLVGDELGIVRAADVLDPRAASELTDLLASELHHPSDAGRHLMRILLREMELSMPWGLRKLPRTLVWHLAGDSVSTMLDVPKPAVWAPAVRVLAGTTSALARLPFGRTIAQAPSRVLGRSVIRMWVDRTIAGDQPTPFHLPAKLAQNWSIGTSTDARGLGLRGRLRRLRRSSRALLIGGRPVRRSATTP